MQYVRLRDACQEQYFAQGLFPGHTGIHGVAVWYVRRFFTDLVASVAIDGSLAKSPEDDRSGAGLGPALLRGLPAIASLPQDDEPSGVD